MSARDDPTKASPDDANTTSAGVSAGGSRFGPDAAGADAPTLPDRIGPFTITRVIATGGMGIVYEALQERPSRTVAVKVMRRGPATTALVRRFEFESEILARLRHPGIAQIFAAGTWSPAGTGAGSPAAQPPEPPDLDAARPPARTSADGASTSLSLDTSVPGPAAESDSQSAADASGLPWFAMEFIPDARSLTGYADHHHLDTPARLELFAQVCDAVHHGHQKGVIHRDLKPANILVDAGGRVKIIDFGVARATDADLVAATMQTRVGQIVGTIRYMSPEQVRGQSVDIDTRSDVYSLGVVLYELLCGRPPYAVDASSIYKAARAIQDEHPIRAGAIDKRLRGDVETILGKSLDKQRDRRYQSAAELGDDIRRYLRREPIAARPPSLGYQLRMFARRHAMLTTASAAIVVILVAIVVVSLNLYERANEARAAADEHRADLIRHADDSQRKYDIAREGADLLLFGVCNELPKIAGTRDLQLELLAKASAHYETLAAEKPDDPAEHRGVWLSFRLLGDAYAAIGELDAAADAIDRGLTMLRASMDEGMTLDVAWQDVASFLGRQGEIAEMRGELDAAETAYRAMLDIDLRELDQYPDRPAQRDAVSIDYERLGDLAARQGDIDAARAWLARREAVARDLIAADPDNERFQRKLGVTLERLGTLAAAAGDDAAARDYFEQSRAISESLYAGAPLNPSHALHLSIICGHLADLWLRSADIGRARALAVRKLELDRALVEAEPRSPEFQDSLGVAWYKLGEIALAERDFAAAERAFREMQDVFAAQIQQHPDLPQPRERLSACLEQIGDLALTRGDVAEARAVFEKKMELDVALLDSEPDNPDYLANLTIAASRIGDLQQSDQHWDAALATYERMRDAVERLHAQAPELQRGRSLLAATELRFGDLARARGDFDDAMKRYDDVGHRIAAWRAASPDDPVLISLHIDVLRAAWDLAVVRVGAATDDSTAAGSMTITDDATRAARRQDLARRARALLDAMIDRCARPDAGSAVLNECAWRLLTVDPADLRDPAAARRLARRAIEVAGRPDPGILDTLALAQFTLGDIRGAIATQRTALEQLPEDEPTLRPHIEANLRRFEAALADEADPSE